MPEKTLADVIAANESLSVNCSHPACCHSVKLDVPGLAQRLGADHGAMHGDLVDLFHCRRCKDAGRRRRPVFFTCIPDYEGEKRRRDAEAYRPTFRAP